MPEPTPQQVYQNIRKNVSEIIHGQEVIVRKLLAALLGGSNALLED